MTSLPVSRETLISLYFPTREAQIRKFADFLISAGIERGVIGPREGEKIWERHIFNCLPVIFLIPEGSSVIDIGSGAGLPGILTPPEKGGVLAGGAVAEVLAASAGACTDPCRHREGQVVF